MSSYTISNFSVPGAASTFANGINDKGEVVGGYVDGAGHEYGFATTASGFVTISVPGAVSTVANGVNDLGQVVGTFVDGSGAEHGFLDSNGTISTVDVPGAVGTAAMAINDSGQIVGSYLSPRPASDPNAVGPAVNAFEDSSGSFITLETGRNDGIKGIVQPFPTGINDSGEVVGTTQHAPAGLSEGWAYVGGAFETLPSPAGSYGFGATGINDAGQIVGWYGMPNTSAPGAAAFIDSNGTLALVSLPGAPTAINDGGQIVGSANGEGFLASPATASADAAKPCFCAGTGIATGHGTVPVEALRPGDAVRTASGRLAVVRWVGQRTVTQAGRAAPDAVAPVRIAAHALAPGLPRRDVRLSPDHAVFVDGVLIPAYLLVNGATIRRDPAVARVTYVHIELDRHDILLADGLPAESYLDTGNRGQFDRECGVRPLYEVQSADPLAATRAAYAARGCATLHLGGDAVAGAHRRLAARAETLGWTLAQDPAVTVTADDRPLSPLPAADGEWAFAIAAGAREVRIRSRRFVPYQMDATRPDGRCLGVPLVLHADGAASAMTYAEGWHAAEAGHGWRWTDGDARLRIAPGAGAVLLRLLRFGTRYWLPPTPREPSGIGTIPDRRGAARAARASR
ncbi:MAG: Hint domain-containing protein [Rhodospirillales bacterium]|nr:Hint domain-containing protein [Rhodospirillales bacterium]